MMNRKLLNIISPGGVGNKLSILIFHRVLNERDDLFPSTITRHEFDTLLSIVKKNFNVLQLSNAVENLKNNTLPPRSLCITFDDGYMDNYTVALPLLKKHALPATFFIATGFTSGESMWNDVLIEAVRETNCRNLKIKSSNTDVENYDLSSLESKRFVINTLIPKFKHLPYKDRAARVLNVVDQLEVDKCEDLMMAPREIKEMNLQGMEIGAHTVTHPILAKLNSKEAKNEIYNSKIYLEDIIDKEITMFAYPNGQPNTDYLSEHVKICKEVGLHAAVSTVWGAARSNSDMYQLPRFTPWRRAESRFMLQMVQNLFRKNSQNSYV